VTCNDKITAVKSNCVKKVYIKFLAFKNAYKITVNKHFAEIHYLGLLSLKRFYF